MRNYEPEKRQKEMHEKNLQRQRKRDELLEKEEFEEMSEEKMRERVKRVSRQIS